MIAEPHIPPTSTIQPANWLAPAAIAVVLHLLVFLNYESSTGARKLGEQGIEIGLKKLMQPTTPAKSQASPSKPKPKKIATPKPRPQPTPAVKMDEHHNEPAPMKPALADTIADAQATPNNTTTGQEESVEDITFGGGNPKVKITYERRLLLWLERHKRYPNFARRRGHEGTIEIEFTIDRDGNVLSHHFITTAAHQSLNDAVQHLLKRASPAPAVPSELVPHRSTFTFRVPIVFKLEK